MYDDNSTPPPMKVHETAVSLANSFCESIDIDIGDNICKYR